MGQSRDRLVTHQADVRTALEVVKAQFRFLIFETTLYAPPREGHVQQDREWRVARGVGNEKLDLVRF